MAYTPTAWSDGVAPAINDTNLNKIEQGIAAVADLADGLTSLVASKAPTESPTFTGIPAVPTAAPGTNTTQAASTAYVTAAVSAVSVPDGDKTDIVVSSSGTVWALDSGVVTPAARTVLDDTTVAAMLATMGGAPLASPTLTGTPAAPTAAQGTNTTQIATTAMVHSEAVLLAPLASPALTGNPTATTQTAGNNSTRLATTAYVDTADALKANIASPTFTGTPAAPTAAQGTNTTQLATTAMVQSEATLLAPKASPTFTGTAPIIPDAAGATQAVNRQTGDARYAPRATFPCGFTVACSDETTAITTGTAKVTFRMPYAMTLTSVRAALTTASSSGIPTFDIKESGTTIFSTKLTVDANEKTSQTAATAAVLSDTALADDAEMTVNFDVAGTGTTGVKLTFIGTRVV